MTDKANLIKGILDNIPLRDEPGYWALRSKSRPSWNTKRMELKNIKADLKQAVAEKLDELADMYGESPDDLELVVEVSYPLVK